MNVCDVTELFLSYDLFRYYVCILKLCITRKLKIM